MTGQGPAHDTTTGSGGTMENERPNHARVSAATIPRRDPGTRWSQSRAPSSPIWRLGVLCEGSVRDLARIAALVSMQGATAAHRCGERPSSFGLGGRFRLAAPVAGAAKDLPVVQRPLSARADERVALEEVLAAE